MRRNYRTRSDKMQTELEINCLEDEMNANSVRWLEHLQGVNDNKKTN